MVLVSVSIHEARISRTFFGGLKASRRWKLKKLIILENIKSNELSLVFSKIVSKGLWCDKVWGISIFSSCTPIRGIYRKSLLSPLKRWAYVSGFGAWGERGGDFQILAKRLYVLLWGEVWYLGVFRQFRVKWSIEIRRFWFRRVVAWILDYCVTLVLIG